MTSLALGLDLFLDVGGVGRLLDQGGRSGRRCRRLWGWRVAAAPLSSVQGVPFFLIVVYIDGIPSLRNARIVADDEFHGGGRWMLWAPS